IDFGTLAQNSPTGTQAFSLFNLASTYGAALTAGLDLDSITGSGDTSILTTNLAGVSNMSAGRSSGDTAPFLTANLGTFNHHYVLHVSDQDLPGATNQDLDLSLTGIITQAVGVPEPSSLLLAGLGVAGFAAFRRRFRPTQTNDSAPVA